MDTEINKVEHDVIMSKIIILRNQKVMLDRDLASLYGVQAIRLREQVKRNIERFPSNFMFQLTESEAELMVSQNAIPSKSYLGGTLPYVFTEHGILMLANVLRSEQAIKMSIRIIEIFIKLREFISNQKDILLKLEAIEKKVDNHDHEIKIIFSALRELIQTPQKTTEKIGFKQTSKK
jgi:hypothetical protein